MMMSAFDQALDSQPLLEERPATKKWCLGVAASTMLASTQSMKQQEEGHDSSMDLEYGGRDDDDDDDNNNNDDSHVEMEEILFDNALLMERHDELFGINTDLHKINTIHQDLAGLVASQDSDIKKMSWFAIETFQNTQSSLEKVVRAAKYSDDHQIHQRRKHLLFSLLAVVVVLCLSRAILIDSDPKYAPNSPADSTVKSNQQQEQQHTPMIHIHYVP